MEILDNVKRTTSPYGVVKVNSAWHLIIQHSHSILLFRLNNDHSICFFYEFYAKQSNSLFWKGFFFTLNVVWVQFITVKMHRLYQLKNKMNQNNCFCFSKFSRLITKLEETRFEHFNELNWLKYLKHLGGLCTMWISFFSLIPFAYFSFHTIKVSHICT